MRNLTRKLFLSICTLAICAVTLVSTTFAWYTTNTEVSATGIIGGSAATGDSSIFISANGNDWAQSVDLKEQMYTKDAEGKLTTTLSQSGLTPVQLVKVDDDVEFQNLEGKGTNVVTLTFNVWFKTAATTSDVTIYLESLVLSNTETNLTAVDNLLNNTQSKDAEGNDKADVGVNRNASTYYVDVTQTLCMMTVASDTSKTKNYFDIGECDTTTPIVDPNVTSGGAEAYYEEVMNKSLDSTKVALQTLTTPNFNLGSRSPIVTVPATGKGVKVEFTVFINGWDGYCYDAIKNQTFTIELGFSSNNVAPTGN